MNNDRRLHEAIARCVSIMVFYQNSERTRGSLAQMRAEIRAVAGAVAEMDLPDGCRADRQVERELMDRYGHELGPRIVADFLNAYGSDSAAVA